MAANISTELTQHLNARHLYPAAAWLESFISTIRPNTPLPAIKQTSIFRLLATDITTSLDQPSNSVFPKDVLTGTIKSRLISGPIVCQVLDIEDIGHSRWSQVEAIETKERGETTKGREIVRVVEQENEAAAEAAAPIQSKGPFKLLLQDAKALKIYAIDLKGIDKLNTNMTIGTKLLLKEIDVRRGVIMLEPGNVQVLGGKIEALDKAWKEGEERKAQGYCPSARKRGVIELQASSLIIPDHSLKNYTKFSNHTSDMLCETCTGVLQYRPNVVEMGTSEQSKVSFVSVGKEQKMLVAGYWQYHHQCGHHLTCESLVAAATDGCPTCQPTWESLSDS